MTQSTCRLQAVREYLGLPLDDVARHTGIGVYRLTRIEALEEEPTAVELKAISAIYKFSPAYLMGAEDAPAAPVRIRSRATTKLHPKDEEELMLFTQFLTAAGASD